MNGSENFELKIPLRTTTPNPEHQHQHQHQHQHHSLFRENYAISIESNKHEILWPNNSLAKDRAGAFILNMEKRRRNKVIKLQASPIKKTKAKSASKTVTSKRKRAESDNNESNKRRKIETPKGVSKTKVDKSLPNPDSKPKIKNKQIPTISKPKLSQTDNSMQYDKSNKHLEIKEVTSANNNSPPPKNAIKASNEDDETPVKNLPANEDLDEPLTKFIVDSAVKKSPKEPEFRGALKELASEVCRIGTEEVTLRELCKEWDIIPLRNGISMHLQDLAWAAGSLYRDVVDLAESLIDAIAKIISTYDRHQLVETQQDFYQELRELVTKSIGSDAQKGADNSYARLKEILPDFVDLIGSWTTTSRHNLDATSSEQDFVTRIYAGLFEPFFCDIDHKACGLMPLPVPYEKYKRLPDMRAFVKTKEGIEFIYLIREDSSDKGKLSCHKDLHKIVQLMRCALRLQILHLESSNERRTLYCFGFLTSGYKIQLLQMQVHLKSEEDYSTPIYQLWIEDELDLLGYDENTLNILLTWLCAIRCYHFDLCQSIKTWKTKEKPRVCMTSKKSNIAKISSTAQYQDKSKADHHSAKNKKNNNNSDSDEDDDENGSGKPEQNSNTNQTSLANRSRAPQISPYRPSKGNSGNYNNNDSLDNETLDAIVRGIDNNEHFVLRESSKYDKRVLLVCTTVKRMRLFVVKVYGPKCEERFMNEINVLKVLKNHPNVGQLLAVRKLDDGSTLAVQPYYENTDRWYQDYHKDLFPPVFVQLAKGLAHIHDRGVIHGDIKPGNFLVDSKCHTRIIDFDMSVRVGIDDIDRLGGTAGYFAPEWFSEHEQVAGSDLTFKVDVWGLAVTMCEFAGKPLGEETDPLKIRQTMLRRLESKTFVLWPVRDIVTRMLSIHPNERPTARQVYNELKHVYGDNSEGVKADEEQTESKTVSNASAKPPVVEATRRNGANIDPKQARKQTVAVENNRLGNKRARENDENISQNGDNNDKSHGGRTKRTRNNGRRVLNDVTNIVK